MGSLGVLAWYGQKLLRGAVLFQTGQLGNKRIFVGKVKAQIKNPVKGDWILQVIEDLKTLNISTDFDKY